MGGDWVEAPGRTRLPAAQELQQGDAARNREKWEEGKENNKIRLIFNEEKSCLIKLPPL